MRTAQTCLDDPLRLAERRAALTGPRRRRLDVSGQAHGERKCQCRGDWVDEQPVLRRGGAKQRWQGGGQRSQRPGQRRDGVVRPEQSGRLTGSGGLGQHRLFQRGERAGLDDVGGDGASKRRKQQQRQALGERECGAGDAHHDQEDAVGGAPSNLVPVSAQRHRGDRRAQQDAGEDDADLGAGEV